MDGKMDGNAVTVGSTSNLWKSIQNGVTSAQQKISQGVRNATNNNWVQGLSQSASDAKKKLFAWNNTNGGGKTRKKHRGGNFRAHSPTHGLAASASSVSGIRTASFKTVGGKRRRSKGKKHPCKKHHHHTSKCRR